MPTRPELPAMFRTLLAAAVGGAIAKWAHVPLAWMIGAMTATTILNLSRVPTRAVPNGRLVALCLLGTSLGQTFTAPVLQALGGALHWLVLSAFVSLIVGAAVSRMTARMAKVDTRTAFFCSVPGGIIVMTVLAARSGVPVAPVTLSQTLRVAVVVLTVPPMLTWLGAHGYIPPGSDIFNIERAAVAWVWLPLQLAISVAGGVVMSRLRLANPWMIGAATASASLAANGVVFSGVPLWAIDVAQVVMGVTLGTRLNRDFLLGSGGLALASIKSVLIVIATLALYATALGLATGLPAGACVLGTAPGGMPEMTLTAKVLNQGIPLVLAFHLVRLAICNFLVEPGFRLYMWTERKLGIDPEVHTAARVEPEAARDRDRDGL